CYKNYLAYWVVSIRPSTSTQGYSTTGHKNMKELKFLLAVWKANLLSVMEYRISFITQVIGMMLNDFMYFAIWIIFFQQFKDVRGWGVDDMYITYGVLASAFGLVSLLFGNAFTLSE